MEIINYLKKELQRHPFDYLLFITVGVFFIMALSIFKGERLIEFVILLSFVSFYIIWGIYHHVIQNSIHLKVVLEYLLIGFTILFLLKIFILP
ncbi:hypothetical protein COY14_04000 [Candidatus Roizmanbacteria bacterium CG_4_10_14_0_2_um_filter_36_9]|uniref:Uncharacterized protein n=1 Tax=Candidatus Roizmanbacteria bacterium CG_4_10_14_0_2_um_filter_36_9 TaxID=1974823 RepID=A0A2M7U310_9BACT|nr:MAG: hypothetical protein COY14_04000 [Candidatus Roizmanbacteria bacterium CG_4_10_14_0_2_um_filter_36_9]